MRGDLLVAIAVVSVVVVMAGVGGCRPEGGEPANPSTAVAVAVSEPVVDCEAAARSAASVSRASVERWVRVEHGATIHVGGTRIESEPSDGEAPAAAALLGQHAGCMQLAWRGPTVELYIAVAEEELARVITKRTRALAAGEVDADGQNEGLWLAPGAPVTIDLGAERPRVRLRVTGVEASGTVAPEVVGTTYRPEPFVAGTEERAELTFDWMMSLFATPDRGAFAQLDLRAGAMALGDGEELLPMTHRQTFTVEEVGRSGEWVEVIVRADDGSYELRGLTPPFLVRPRPSVLLGELAAGPAKLPAGTVLYDPRGVIVGRTSAAGRYEAGDEAGEIRVETPWGKLEVRTDAAPQGR